MILHYLWWIELADMGELCIWSYSKLYLDCVEDQSPHPLIFQGSAVLFLECYLDVFRLFSRISIITVTSICLLFFILSKILDMDLERGPFSLWLVMLTHNHSFKGCSFKCWSNEWFWNFQRHLDFSLVLVLLSCEHGHFIGISSFFFFPCHLHFSILTFHNCIVIIFEFFLCTGYLKLIYWGLSSQLFTLEYQGRKSIYISLQISISLFCDWR